jgi:hypothetical protein
VGWLINGEGFERRQSRSTPGNAQIISRWSARFEVLPAVLMTNLVFCNTTPYRLSQPWFEAETSQVQVQSVSYLDTHLTVCRLHLNWILAYRLPAAVLPPRTERTQLARLLHPRYSTGGQAFSRCKKHCWPQNTISFCLNFRLSRVPRKLSTRTSAMASSLC